jgi:hypothetical protein
MEDEQRMLYFLHTTADNEVVYGLRHGPDEWVSATDEESGREVFPVWPHPRFAERCATGAWDGAEVEEVSLDAWLGFLSELEQDGDLVGVMLRPDGNQVVVEPAQHRADLEHFREDE